LLLIRCAKLAEKDGRLSETARKAAVQAYFDKARTLIDRAWPADDPRSQMDRAVAFLALGDQKKAKDSYLKAVEHGATTEQRSRFVQAGDLDPAWKLIEAKPRQVKDGEKVCREGIAIMEEMIARFPEPIHRWQLADLKFALGWALQHGRQSAEAAKTFQEETELREELTAKFGSKPEQRRQLSRTYTALGIAK